MSFAPRKSLSATENGRRAKFRTTDVIAVRASAPYGDAGLLFRRTNEARARDRKRLGGTLVRDPALTSEGDSNGWALKTGPIGGAQ